MKKFSKFEINEKSKDIGTEDVVAEIKAILKQGGHPYKTNMDIVESVEMLVERHEIFLRNMKGIAKSANAMMANK